MPQSPNQWLESEFVMKLDKKYFQIIIKQNGGHFMKSIFLENSLSHFWFGDWGVKVEVFYCIFLIKSKSVYKLTKPYQLPKVERFVYYLCNVFK